jgi:radical SAM-linked protein
MRGEIGVPVRLRYTKIGKVRFVSQRDLARSFERAFRIRELPLSFTLGFSPRPKVSFGLALGVGHESLAEYLDLELAESVPVDDLPAALSAELPEGVEVADAAEIAPRAPSLQEAVTTVQLEVRFAGLDAAILDAALAAAWESEHLPVRTTRKGREIVEDLRPSLRRLGRAASDPTGATIDVETATHPRGVRPADIITSLRELAGASEPQGEDRVRRTHQWIERDGARYEPLEADRAMSAAVSADISSKGLNDERRDDSDGEHRRRETTNSEREADTGTRVGVAAEAGV